MPDPNLTPSIVIACGGTGGHLFPGMAVGEALRARGARCRLLVSMKRVDRHALDSASGMDDRVEPLPAVGWDWRRPWAFIGGLWRAWGRVQAVFGAGRPDAVLTMGGFTGVAPVVAGLRLGVPVFLHESNTVPGRANRWLAPWARAVFLGFPQAAARLRTGEVKVSGTPVRLSIRAGTSATACRRALGLRPDRPTLLIMGGSQGARAINRLVLGALERWRTSGLRLQFVHLTGEQDEITVRAAYRQHGFVARVAAFLGEMDLALGAADLAVSRAGASSLAELAAARLPSVLIPFPDAADNHQLCNARVYERAGAAYCCEQESTDSGALADQVRGLLERPEERAVMSGAVSQWHRPGAAVDIAEFILAVLASGRQVESGERVSSAGEGKRGAVRGVVDRWPTFEQLSRQQGGLGW